MIRICDYCRGPISDSSHIGRPWPDRPAASYCCYGCLSLGESERGESQPQTKSSFKLDGFALRIGVGLLVASQSMVFGLAINLEEQTPRAVKLAVQGVILAGTLLVLALLGPPLFRNAFSEIRRGRLTIEALFLLTMAGAMFASLQSFIAGDGPIYFEVVTVLLVVYSLGKAIGARSRAAALAATRVWAKSLSMCRLSDGEMVDVASVRSGDLVEVRPGETIAVDGVVRDGIGFVSEAPVSGEPYAVVKRPGDGVLAGMISHDAAFRIEATSPGTARQIDRLLEAVEEARSRPTSLQAQADWLGRIFFPLIVITAIVTFVVWTDRSGWQTGLFNAMSVLLVACPCALGLATPIVLWSALNRLAERGIVANTGDAIEKLSQIDCVVFDKTGTLTEDQFALVDIATLAEGEERARILGWLALVEEKSSHPIARAFASPARSHPLTPTLSPEAGEREEERIHPLPRFGGEGRVRGERVVSLRAVAGCGIEAEIEERGDHYCLRVGRPEWIAAASTDEKSLLQKLHAKTGHRVDFEIDGHLAAIALISERLRDSVPETLATLQNMGFPVQVLTGDTSERAAALALPNAQGRLLPEDKHRRIEELNRDGRKPLMIGDGINDASALAAAHAGIALASGTDLANSAASATLYHGDLRAIPWAIALSRDAVRAVRRNLLRAAAYNMVGITLAAFGVLHPVVAALLMVVSSLLVAWSSVRVGGTVEMCACPTTSTVPRAIVHVLALAAQAVVALLLVKLSSVAAFGVVFAFIFIGIAMAIVWSRWTTIPHTLDMAIGMLTLGNLGMLLGWWADNGFTRLHEGDCCACVAAVRDGLFKPWMWLGMLLFANIAMAFLSRRPHPEIRWCKTTMFTGGNLGMIAGMMLGGWLAGSLRTESIALAALISYVGMTIGMVGGMLLGTEAARRAISRITSWKLVLQKERSVAQVSNL